MEIKPHEIRVLVKLKDHFIDQKNLRAMYRFGAKTRVERILGDDFIVDLDYDEVKKMFPLHKVE